MNQPYSSLATTHPGPPCTDGESFEPVESIHGREGSRLLFLCDHASNRLPAEYGTLGLDPGQFERHIAWDIGAADVTRELARHFQAPAILARFSRLLIDPNRGDDDPTLVMRISDGAIIPGNVDAGPQETDRRRRLYWQPYRDAGTAAIDAMLQAGCIPAIVSIHSYTDRWKGRLRPWEIGLMWDSDPRLAARLHTQLSLDPNLCIGDNEPYGTLVGDVLYQHAMLRGLPHVLIEIRQDLIATPAGARQWAERIAAPLAASLDEDIFKVKYYRTRAGSGYRIMLNDHEALRQYEL